MESDKTTEARRRAQRNGEEDPVVVAQRFLNIYRQIHVFNDEKKASFNQMLMELSPEIRGMFGNLPGGTLLQEYVDELAEQNGVEKSVQANNVKIDEEDAKQAKILAMALAETQVQATGGQTIVAPTAANTPVAEAKLSMDKNFAQEFANALSGALSRNSQGIDKELKSIIANLGRTQMEMIKVLKEDRSTTNTFAAPIAHQTQTSAQSSYFPDFETNTSTPTENNQVIQQLLNGQQQILNRLAKVESGSTTTNSSNDINLEKLISNLYENQKRDSMKMAQTIAEAQNKLAKAIVQNNTLNQNSSNIQINSTDYSGILANIADKLGKMSNASQKIEVKFPMQPFNALINTQSAIYREIATAQNKERSTIITELLKANRLYLQSIADTIKAQPVIVPPAINTNIDDYATSETFIHPYGEDNTDNFVYPNDNSNINNDPSKKKKKKKKNKFLDDADSNEKMTLTDTLVSTISKGFELLKHKEEIDKTTNIENNSIDNAAEQTVFEQNIPQYSSSPQPKEQTPMVEEIVASNIDENIDITKENITPDNIEPSLPDKIPSEEIVPVEDVFSIEDDNIPSFTINDDLTFDEPLNFDKPDTADDWGFSNSDDTGPDTDIDQTSVSNQSWNFNSEEELSEEKNNNSEEEWEWEYVEDDDANASADDDEWEYVEVDDASALSDDDEWEYVEVDDNNGITASLQGDDTWENIENENFENLDTDVNEQTNTFDNQFEEMSTDDNLNFTDMETDNQIMDEKNDNSETENIKDIENLETTPK